MTYTPYQFANNASTTVAGGDGGLGTTLNPSDTTLYLPTGHGADFPASGYFMIQIGTTEYAKVTLNSSDTFTIVRAQEGTSAGTWPVGTTVQAIMSAQAFNDGMTELATLDSAKANLSGAAFTGNISTSGTLGATGASTLSSTAHIVGAATFDSTLAVTGTTTLTGAATLTNGITSYKSTTTAGLGVPVIVASSGLSTVTSTATQTIIDYTPAANGFYRASMSVSLNNGTSGNAVLAALAYTDNSASGGHRFAGVQTGATTVVALDGSTSRTNGDYALQPFTFYATTSSHIQITFQDPAHTPSDHVWAIIELLG